MDGLWLEGGNFDVSSYCTKALTHRALWALCNVGLSHRAKSSICHHSSEHVCNMKTKKVHGQANSLQQHSIGAPSGQISNYIFTQANHYGGSELGGSNVACPCCMALSLGIRGSVPCRLSEIALSHVTNDF